MTIGTSLGYSNALATAMIDGRPVVPGFELLYGRVLRENIALMTAADRTDDNPPGAKIIPFAPRG